MMGVAGSGKTTVGALLAEALGWRFVDADDIHSAENRAKMSGGEPLSDADREPWLEAVATEVLSGQVVVACSALRQAYRDRLGDARYVFLEIEEDDARSRLEARPSGHFPAALIESQFATLEEPEDAFWLDARLPPDVLVELIIDQAL